jgi:hypothetical protein
MTINAAYRSTGLTGAVESKAGGGGLWSTIGYSALKVGDFAGLNLI